jgi:uncharacterized DUF497 family protein
MPSMAVPALNGTNQIRTRTGSAIEPAPKRLRTSSSTSRWFVRSDIRHSRREKRYYALGQTSNGRYLFGAFTIRRSLVRIISVRDMNRRERDAYAKHENEAGA